FTYTNEQMSAKSQLKKLLPTKVFRAVEPYGHLVEAFVVNLLNGFPGKGLKVIGVTGTNGKTSTSMLIYKMLDSSGYKTGLMTTIEWGIGGELYTQEEHYTNVPVRELMGRLKQMKKAKVDWLVLETTSQGLSQHRVFGIDFSVAVITNLTHEHLDYHGTFANYRSAKQKLFKLANRNRSGLRTGVVNADDDNYEYFAGVVENKILYGINKGDLRAKDIDLKATGSTYVAEIDGDKYKIKCNLPGSFNVYNSLAAIGVGRAVGLSKEQIESGIASLKSVKGRMTEINEGQDFEVIVDFAHTPDSFEKLFKDIKPLVKGRLIVMFGSPGRRDVAKRAAQGDLAGKYADLIVLTEEDDRDVDGMAIIKQIVSGVEKHGRKLDKDYFVVRDRTEAISFTFRLAKKGDVVLLLGKGHERTIESNDGTHPWDEIRTAHDALKAIVKK
ncbi:MAG TPA: UDP-N-acetylmuramoyl-L-alanyl-D-glutamate--2,6-diaminopimelate ligase, partial [Candidatus Sulfotelmatobacter sp.]|nr:UDP-N-acetylmuramoyl-L-alanyl-D-glutamate--2,6-diaminopimelate ligase [Candidatus Sulfotelmatobacter sp.]